MWIQLLDNDLINILKIFIKTYLIVTFYISKKKYVVD